LIISVKYRKDFNVLDVLCACNAKGLIDEDGMIEELETLLSAVNISCSF
jgi:hypothetical protein